MRVTSILIAAVVAGVLYLLVQERDRLFGFAQDDAEQTVVSETVNADATPDEAPAETPDEIAIAVSAIDSVAQPVENAVLLRGQTEAARQVELRAEVNGQVTSTPLRKGVFVEEGQLMCEVDPGTSGASLAEAKARLASAQAAGPETAARVIEAQARLTEAEINFNAASKLSNNGFASDTQVANTEAGVEAAKASLEAAKSGILSVEANIQSAEAAVAAAENQINKLRMTAPFSGLLETDTAEIGAFLQPGALCGTIIQLDPIKLVGFAPEADIDKLTVGARAGARLASGREVVGTVSFLSRSADQTTRTFRVEVEVANADLSIRDGQTAEIIVASDDANAHLLPQSSLTLNDLGDLGVRIVNQDSRVDFVEVALIHDTIDGVWVSGLPETVRVIVSGQEYVTTNVLVDVTLQESEQ